MTLLNLFYVFFTFFHLLKVTNGSTNISNLIGASNCFYSPRRVFVSIRYRGQHVCVGTIITSKFILTAANCVDGESEQAQVTDVIKNTEIYHLNLIHKIKDIHIHPNFTGSPYFYNDIALIELKKRLIRKSGGYRIMRLPVERCSTEVINICDRVIVSGPGNVRNPDGVDSLLRCAKVPIISKEDCYESLARRNMDKVKEQLGLVTCTYNTERGVKNVCKGDVGGPLSCKGSLYGVLSFGYFGECAIRDNFPAIYTKVHCYLRFILKTVSHEAVYKKHKVDVLRDVEYPFPPASHAPTSWKTFIIFVPIVLTVYDYL